MPPSDYTLLAKYPQQGVVKERNYLALNNWASYIATLPIPGTKPNDAWVKARIVAERFPSQPQSYIDRTMSYFLQDPATQTNIRQYLNQWNDEATEVSLAAQLEGIVNTFMPRFADIDVTQQQVNDWLTAHGFTP